MTKHSIQSLKKENDDLKCKLETLTKDFKELKDLEKNETTARDRQDSVSSSPYHKLEYSHQWRIRWHAGKIIQTWQRSVTSFGQSQRGIWRRRSVKAVRLPVQFKHLNHLKAQQSCVATAGSTAVFSFFKMGNMFGIKDPIPGKLRSRKCGLYMTVTSSKQSGWR